MSKILAKRRGHYFLSGRGGWETNVKGVPKFCILKERGKKNTWCILTGGGLRMILDKSCIYLSEKLGSMWPSG